MSPFVIFEVFNVFGGGLEGEPEGLEGPEAPEDIFCGVDVPLNVVFEYGPFGGPERAPECVPELFPFGGGCNGGTGGCVL